MDILQAIGNTSMVRLRKVVPPRCADVLVKLEWENPTGNMKDRMAHAVISRAEADGAQRRHLIQLLAAERVGADDLQPVALGGAHQRQRCARAAPGVLGRLKPGGTVVVAPPRS
jgi:pyridoxal-phosphate dependent enzyme